MLSTGIEKVIYLDCDLVLDHDLGALWDIAIGEAEVLAVADADPSAHLVSSSKGILHHRELGLPADLEFFNSGNWSINLHQWREEFLLPLRVVTYLREVGDDVLWYDQEALNAAIAGAWSELDPRWNVTMHVHGDPRTAASAPSPFIVHYNGEIKPWQAGYPHGHRALFFEHLDRTAWAGWRPPQPPLVGLRRLGRTAIKAVRKRRHRLGRALGRWRRRLHAFQVLRRPLRRLDLHPLPAAAGAELRLFVVGDRPGPELASRLDRYHASGCDRAFLAFLVTDGGDGEIGKVIEGQSWAHVLTRAGDARSDHEVLRHLLHHHGQGHWCLILGADERLAAPEPTAGSLKDLCSELDAGGFEAWRCWMIDRADPTGQNGGESGVRRITTIARDPLTDRVFRAAIDVASDVDWLDGPVTPRSRVVLLRYRPELALAPDLRSVAGVREADSAGVVLRSAEPLTPPAASAPAAR